jgi:hypothetical protein
VNVQRVVCRFAVERGVYLGSAVCVAHSTNRADIRAARRLFVASK